MEKPCTLGEHQVCELMQSRKMSLIEIVSGQVIALLIAWVTQIIVFPLFGIEIPHGKGLLIVMIFACISMIRSYCVRRIFNKFKEGDGTIKRTA